MKTAGRFSWFKINILIWPCFTVPMPVCILCISVPLLRLSSSKCFKDDLNLNNRLNSFHFYECSSIKNYDKNFFNDSKYFYSLINNNRVIFYSDFYSYG